MPDLAHFGGSFSQEWAVPDCQLKLGVTGNGQAAGSVVAQEPEGAKLFTSRFHAFALLFFVASCCVVALVVLSLALFAFAEICGSALPPLCASAAGAAASAASATTSDMSPSGLNSSAPGRSRILID
jgi:hypothetical protein